ncbi:MAG: outer membrane protein assembly factor BamD [Pseudomonadota bacterium]
MIRKFSLTISILLVIVLLVGCSQDDGLLDDMPAEQLYTMAMAKMEDRNYEKAAKVFDEVDRQHPYSKWATKAQLMMGYCYYQVQKYDRAVAAFETFIQLHPGHADVDYALYMRGVCYYEQIFNVRRDQKMAVYAYEALVEVVKRFPNSRYGKDARYKIDLVRDHMAGKEMSIGRYYLKRDAYLSAINRFRTVVERYETTAQAPEALHRLVESYLSLGLTDEAQAAAAVLGNNYPGSHWYADSYYLLKGVDLRPEESKVGASWMNRLLGKRLEG